MLELKTKVDGFKCKIDGKVCIIPFSPKYTDVKRIGLPAGDAEKDPAAALDWFVKFLGGYIENVDDLAIDMITQIMQAWTEEKEKHTRDASVGE